MPYKGCDGESSSAEKSKESRHLVRADGDYPDTKITPEPRV